MQDNPKDSSDVRLEDDSTLRMLTSAFPQGVPEEGYLPLVYILAQELGFRGTASVLSRFTGKNYYIVYNDVARALGPEVPDSRHLEEIQEQLRAYGYTEWLEEE